MQAASLTLQMLNLVHKHLDSSLGKQPAFGKTARRESEFKSPSEQYSIRRHEFVSQHGTMQHSALGTVVHYSDKDHVHAEYLSMDFTLIDGFLSSQHLWQRSMQCLYFCLKMGPEGTIADEATGPGSQWALKWDVLYAAATRSPPQQFPKARGSGAPHAERPVLYHLNSYLQLQIRLQACMQGESSPFFRERQIAKHFLFKLLLSPLWSGSCTISDTPTLHGAPCSRSNFLQLPGESLLQKGGRHQKISRFCFTLDFKVVKGEGTKKENKKARENKNRTKPEQFLLQLHTPEEKQRNTSRDIPCLCHQGSETGCHDSHSTTAASSRRRNLPLETRYRQSLTNVVCISVWHPVSWGL